LKTETNPHILNKTFSGLSDSELMQRVIDLKGERAIPSEKYRKSYNFKKPTLPDTVFNLTKGCTNDKSEYFSQKDICSNIVGMTMDLETRKLKLEWDNGHKDEIKSVKTFDMVSDKQNEWVVMVAFVRSIFNNKIIMDVPTNSVDLIEYYNQSSQSAKIIALYLGIILEFILITLSYIVFKDGGKRKKQGSPKELTKIEKWFIYDILKKSKGVEVDAVEKPAITIKPTRKSKKSKIRTKVDWNALLEQAKMFDEKIKTQQEYSELGFDLSLYQYAKLKKLMSKKVTNEHTNKANEIQS
jgi:hypothetical protein